MPGLASGPAWRLIGTTAVGLLLLHFTPTKWAVQFGAFAGLAAALGAVTAFAFALVGLHSRRNLALYVTALLFVLAWATSGINAWFYVGNYGVPWFDQPAGDRRTPGDHHVPGPGHHHRGCWPAGCTSGWTTPGTPRWPNTRRNRALASTPLLVVATHHGGARSRLDGQGLRPALPRVHHRQGQRRAR